MGILKGSHHDPDAVDHDGEKERQKKIFDLQCPSTQKAMALHQKGSSLREEMPPIPINWKAYEGEINDDNYFECVGARVLSHEEYFLHNGDPEKGIYGLRQKAGERLAEIHGDKPATSMTPKKIERAIDAFMNVSGNIKEKFKQLYEIWGLADLKEKVKK